jgi:DUF4097 and DUF4098 domain-containing protein YvlB
MTGRKVGLLLLILAFGGAVETAHRLRAHLRFGPTGWRILGGSFRGPSHEFEAEETRELARGTSLDVRNSFGRVSVAAGEPGAARVRLRRVVFAETEGEARAFAERLRLRAEVEGGALLVGTNREEISPSLREADVGFETHLEIVVPADTPVAVRNDHGEVAVVGVARADVETSFDGLRVERVAGEVRVRNSHGAVAVHGVGGPLEVNARHGDVEATEVRGAARMEVERGDLRLTGAEAVFVGGAHGEVFLESVAGDLEVRRRHSAVRARKIRGRTDLETTFGDVRLADVEGELSARVQHGEVHVEDARGPVTVSTTHEDVSLLRLGAGAEVTVEHGGVTIGELVGPAKVAASGGDVAVRAFRGRVEVHGERAAVSLEAAGPLEAPVEVETSFGDVSLDLPEGGAFELDASSPRGEVTAALPGLEVSESSRERLRGRLGARGVAVRLAARNGDVRVTGLGAGRERP